MVLLQYPNRYVLFFYLDICGGNYYVGKQSYQNGGSHNCFVRSTRDEIQSNFVQATKFDVAMNSLLVRGKNLGTFL